ncbi:MAG: transposase [Acidovorax sp.]|uniref:transposase n=1 Tax=Acidovorax sp. TaxID=1872122 RepID=UPI0025C22B56|nr:transposase [Acidovorax sp.]MCE1191466.1 transposase [Acidovorax sp.]
MARLPRLTLPGHLHHVLQRGNNRQPIFADREDYETMLALLADNAPRHGIAVHAYVLMGNHFHLLATPSTADGLPQWMQAVGRRYVQYFNRRHGRTGTLWEGRYRCAILEPERYLVPAMVYLDWNPVRAGLAAQPADYPWSSHAHWVGLRNDRLLTPHAQYWALGNTPFAREAAYAQRVQVGIGSAEQQALTDSALGGWALGSPEFVEALQQRTPRRVARGRAGRPPAARPE